MVREVHDETEAFAAEVCWHYYVNGMTQAEIAQQLDATRLRVNQAIQRAKSCGMVKVQIESPFIARIELQEAIRAELGLARVLVAPARRDAYDCHSAVGAALAGILLLVLTSSAGRWFGELAGGPLLGPAHILLLALLPLLGTILATSVARIAVLRHLGRQL